MIVAKAHATISIINLDPDVHIEGWYRIGRNHQLNKEPHDCCFCGEHVPAWTGKSYRYVPDRQYEMGNENRFEAYMTFCSVAHRDKFELNLNHNINKELKKRKDGG
jgi:hypothetical protein